MLTLAEFALGATTILIIPGPTNTLLAAGAAADGFQRSLPLVIAEALGYATAATALELLANPAIAMIPLLRVGAQFLCAVYLIFLAWKLWSSNRDVDTRVVTFRRLFVATISNPKAMIFAFILLHQPAHAVDWVRICSTYVPLLLALIIVAGTGWLLIGALVRAGAGSRGLLVTRRVSSVAIAMFGVAMVAGVAHAQH
jgi:threonine/homoserine/homoserine lactone efflux protein